MVKTHTTLTVDPEILKRAREKLGNLSQLFQEALESHLNTHETDIAGINYNLEKIKEKKMLKERMDLDIKIKETQEKLRIYEEEVQKKKEERLKMEKDEIERKTICQNCGAINAPKTHNFPIGAICNSCYLSSTKDQIKKWNAQPTIQK